MYISSVWIVALSVITVGYILRSAHFRATLLQKDARILELERTVEKLKTKNGKLRYDTLHARKPKVVPAPRDPNELTITTKLAT